MLSDEFLPKKIWDKYFWVKFPLGKLRFDIATIFASL